MRSKRNTKNQLNGLTDRSLCSHDLIRSTKSQLGEESVGEMSGLTFNRVRFCIFLSVFLSMVLLQTTIFADDPIPVTFQSMSTIQPGQTLDIPVKTTMDITGRRIIGIQGRMIFNPQYVSIVPTNAIIRTGTMTQNWGGAVVNIVNGNELRFNILDVQNPLVWTPQVNSFIKIRVTLSSDYPQFQTYLTFSELLLVDENERALAITPAQPRSNVQLVRKIIAQAPPVPIP